MKKNAMMKIAAILMVAVLLTTCAISSTFAKYVTSDDSADSARVAAFGVTVTTEFDTLFASKYDKADADLSVNADGTLGYSINDLVAPGTQGGVTTASVITGTPEVAVSVVTTADVELGDKWVDQNGLFYCPVIFTINNTPYAYNTVTDQNDDDKVDVTDFELALEKAITNANNKTFAPNTNLANEKLDVSITWAWAFETAVDDPSTPDVDEGAVADARDTFLGNQAAGLNDGKVKAAGQISITLTQTVTQMDTRATDAVVGG